MLTARAVNLGAISSGGWMVLDKVTGKLVPYRPAAATSTKPWIRVSAPQYAQVRAVAAKPVVLSPQEKAAAEWEARRQRAAAATAREKARIDAARRVAEQKRAVIRAESRRKAAEQKAKAAAIRERTRRQQAAAQADYERRAAEKRAQVQAAARRKEREIAAAIAESERRAAQDWAKYYEARKEPQKAAQKPWETLPAIMAPSAPTPRPPRAPMELPPLRARAAAPPIPWKTMELPPLIF